ncbi:histone-lysine N-methyltransferase SETMAR [Cephus cinctus]|uniref:Histone-lysine N-methyltransferase SETMAR n=1 Tax=Cephus cinctus TaxID=211228 RepID=A0AAJ7VZX2_CEPCN|nr:histone-lysine N-methyltransferase SETMAR [Cephus cinctus]
MEAVTREDEYEHVTLDVMYITSNIPGPGVNLDDFESEFSHGCTCKSSCTTSCSCTRGFLNYTDSRINQDKLSGPVVECNSNCKCDINCGNRLIQHGPLDCLTVRETQSKGLGLVTEKIIRKGQFICEYAGEVIGLEEARRRVEINKRTNSMNYVLVVSEHVSSNTIVTCIDPKYFGNIGRYGNHSCQPNSTLVPVRVEGVIPRLCLFASRDIQANEEVTFDYGGGVENSVQVHSDTPCLCGADNCLSYLPHHPI